MVDVSEEGAQKTKGWDRVGERGGFKDRRRDLYLKLSIMRMSIMYYLTNVIFGMY